MSRRYPISEFNANRFSEFFGNQANGLEARLLSGGACNSNYSVCTPSGNRFVCRIHNRGNPHIEKSIIRLLNNSISTPEYLWVGDGVSVMSFIEGEQFYPTKNLVREAGRMIGKLKSISFDRQGQILPSGKIVAFAGWASFEEGILGLLKKDSVKSRVEEDSVAHLKHLLGQHNDILDSFDSCHNLVHGDFRPDNILVSGDSIVGVLDWEFAHSGCSYMDVGNLLRHIPSEWEDDLAWGLREEGFELPDNWRFRSYLIDLASHLEFLTSNHSENFKRSCVDRITQLIKIGTEQ